MIKLIVSFFTGITLFTSCVSDQRYSGSEAIKFEQYKFQGEQLYQALCMNCHQKDGTGLGKLIPPLNSKYLLNHKELAMCIIKNGMSGPILVNDVTYNGTMPANPKLTPLEIAEIMTYIGNSWSNDIGMVTTQEVTQNLTKCNN